MRDSIYAIIVVLCFVSAHTALKLMLRPSPPAIEVEVDVEVDESSPKPLLREELPLNLHNVEDGAGHKALQVSVFEGNEEEGERIVLQLV